MDISLDFFPANLRVGDTIWSKVRVVIAGNRALAFGSDGGVLTVAAAAATIGPFQPSGLPYRIPVEDGEWVVTRAQGCGCGSILRSTPQDHLLALAT